MSFEELHQQGERTFAALVPGGEQRLADIFRIAPDLAELAVGTVYGHLHHRTALDSRTREAVALGAIIASGMTGTPLTVHLRTGLAAGLAPAEIVEIILQAAAFSGFPRAVSTLPTVERVFADAEIPTPVPLSPRQAAIELLAQHRQAQNDARLSDSGSADDAEPPSEGTHTEVYTISADEALAVITSDKTPDQSPTVLYVRCRDGEVIEAHWLTEQPAK